MYVNRVPGFVHSQMDTMINTTSTIHVLIDRRLPQS
jgi:hypothetical protein